VPADQGWLLLTYARPCTDYSTHPRCSSCCGPLFLLLLLLLLRLLC
jgi:hypothetical protein